MKTDGEIKKNGKASSKKIILSVSAVCIAFVILYFVFYLISDRLNGNKKDDTTQIKFYSPAYSRDIMNDPKYLDLDRQYYFTDESNGTTVAITDDEASEVPSTLRNAFLCVKKYLQYAISGDSKSLNGLFSDSYFANGGEKKENFTEQKLYDIYISGNSGEEQSGKFTLTVEYKIKHNNGTFRNDMGSDCSKKEYFLIADYNGNFGIDLIYTNKSVN